MRTLLMHLFKNKLRMVIFLLCVITTYPNAKYVETMDTTSVMFNLVSNFGLVNDSAKTNQTAIVQKAIDSVASLGGGRLIMPKGIYKFADVYMMSNVHLLIEAGTIIKPDWPAGEKVTVFTFNVKYEVWKNNPEAYIENASIRGIGGKFIVDYHDRIRVDGEGCRAITFSMVKNFLVENMDVKDNYTTYCGMTLSPSKSQDLDVSSWEVSRPTNGTIRQCRIFRASPGYGLVQLHGAQSIYFENLYALGGVTLRLETGANTKNIGVYNITGKNIVNEKGRCALMLAPHSAKNGIVKVDSVTSIGSEFAVSIGMGGVKEGAPDQTPGYFSSDSKISNIHAIFGVNAQFKNQHILFIPKEYYDSLRLWPDNKFIDGPSIAPVSNNAETYNVEITNVTSEGFPYNEDAIIDDSSAREGKWSQEFATWKDEHNTDSSDVFRTDKGAVITNYKISDYVDDEIETVLGLKPINEDNIQLYPNPAVDYVTFSIKIKGQILLVNSNGNVIRKIRKGKVLVRDLIPSLYYIVIKCGNEIEVVKPFYKVK